jgi:hypothetical protein
VYNVAQLPKRLLFASGDPQDESLFTMADQGAIVWFPEVVTRGDVMIKCKHYGTKKKETIFKSTFHTAFVGMVEQFEMKDLDAILKRKKRHRPDQYPDDFAVIIYFERLGNETSATSSNTNSAIGSAVAGTAKEKRVSVPIVKPRALNGVKPCVRCLLFIPREATTCYLCKGAQ